jgi:hypothetical protein
MSSLAFHLHQLGSALGDRRVTPSTPAGRTPLVRTAEPPAPAGERDHSSSWTAYLCYIDADGEPSERRFTCHSIGGFEFATHVSGFCHERQAPRMFRVDRIRELVCADSGECFDASTHFDLLRETGALRVEDKVLADVARLLVFLARCDGEYHPMERDTLSAQFERYCVRFNGTNGMLEAVTTGCGQLAPDSTDMIKAIGRLARSKGGSRVARFVLDAGAAVIDADRRHAPEETRWAVEMSNVLKAVCDGRAR